MLHALLCCVQCWCLKRNAITVRKKVGNFYQAGKIRGYQLVKFTKEAKFYQLTLVSKFTRCLAIITNQRVPFTNQQKRKITNLREKLLTSEKNPSVSVKIGKSYQSKLLISEQKLPCSEKYPTVSGKIGKNYQSKWQKYGLPILGKTWWEISNLYAHNENTKRI